MDGGFQFGRHIDMQYVLVAAMLEILFTISDAHPIR